MVTDQEIAKGVETLLRQSDPNAVTSLNDVVQQLEANLGLDLSHKAGFIRDQISFLLRSEPVPKDQLTPEFQSQYPNSGHSSQQFLSPHVVFQQQLHQQHHPSPPPVQSQVRTRPPPPPPLTVATTGNDAQNVVASASATPKGSTPTGTKRRGGPGGLNKVCGVSPELQAIVGEPALPRTEIVKQLWAYIRKHNLQDPSNKRKIICDDALRVVFETDCTDMFKMNKLLAKHITALDPTKEPGQGKKQKVEDFAEKESTESSPPLVLVSDSLLKFFGTGEREMLQSEVLERVWEYIKAHQLEDPSNSTTIRCDAKLQELLGCKSISALGIQEIIARRHLFKR